MNKKTRTFILVLALGSLAACSSQSKVGHVMRVMSECYGFNDSTCEANQVKEYRSDSLGPNPTVIIKE